MRYYSVRAMMMVIAVLALTMTACVKQSGLDYITVAPTTQSIAAGQTAQFTATGTFGNAKSPTTSDVTSQVTWTSSNPAVATISTAGLATGVSAGTATITATIQGYNGLKTASATLTVTGSTQNANKVVSISVIPSTLSVASPGLSGQLIAIGTTGAGVQLNLTGSVTWSSSSTSVATVSSCISGGVTYACVLAKSQGSATISAVYTNTDNSVATGTSTFTVTSNIPASNVTALTLTPSTLSVAYPGQTAQLQAMGATAGGTTLNVTGSVTWSSSNTAVATVTTCTSGGITYACVTGNKQGSAVITAVYTNADQTVASNTASFTVVNDSPTGSVTSIALLPGSLTVDYPGQIAQLQAIGSTSSNLSLNLTGLVTWGSSNTAVATVATCTTGGVTYACVTGKGKGTAIITALYTNTNTNNSVATGSATFTVVNSSTSANVTTLTVTPGTVTIPGPGQYGYLQAIGSIASSTSVNLTSATIWSSSNPSVATVETCQVNAVYYGCVHAITQGAATITATYTNPSDSSVVTSTAAITVANGSTGYTSLNIYPGNLSAAVGQQSQFFVVGTKSSTGLTTDLTNDANTAWSSSNTAIATVDTYGAANPGLVTAKAVGTATITARYTNASDHSVIVTQATYTVTANASSNIVSIALMPSTLSVASPGDTAYIKAIGTTAAGTSRDLSDDGALGWSSSNNLYATVDRCTFNTQVYGCVAGVSQSTSSITAIYTNADGTVATGTASFTVTNSSATAKVTGLTVTPSTLTIAAPTQVGYLQAFGSTSATTSVNLTEAVKTTWSTSNASIATVAKCTFNATPYGCVTAVGQGTVTITATYTNADNSTVSSTATITVANNNSGYTKLNIYPGNLTGAINQQSQLFVIGEKSATGQLTDLTDNAGTVWSSSNTAIATVDSYGAINPGLITAKAAGTATITARFTDPSDHNVIVAQATYTVTATASSDIVSIALMPSTLSVSSPGDKGYVKAIGTTAAGTSRDLSNDAALKWSTSNDLYATVESCTLNTQVYGCIAGVSQSTSTITAVYTNTDNTVATGSASFTVTNSNAAAKVTALTLTPSTLAITALGQKGYLQAFGSTSTTTSVNLTTSVSWSSSNPNIASVVPCTYNTIDFGCVTANNLGSATITATYTNTDNSTVTSTAAVTVTNTSTANYTALTVYPASQSASAGQTTQFLLMGLQPSTGRLNNLTSDAATVWTSSNEAIASVSTVTKGLVTAKSAGSVTITATFTNPVSNHVVTAQATYTVTGVAAKNIVALTLTPSTLSVDAPNDSGYVKAIGQYADGTFSDLSTDGNLKWSSSNDKYATVESYTNPADHQTYGRITGVNQSTSTITAVYTNIDSSVATATASFTVIGNTPSTDIKSLTITPSTLSVAYPTLYAQVQAFGTNTAGLVKDVTADAHWISSNPEIATADFCTGSTVYYCVTGHKQGAATITATYTNSVTSTTATGSASFTVVNNSATGTVTALTLLPGTAAVDYPDEYVLLRAIAQTSTGLSFDLTSDSTTVWSTSNSGVATIDTCPGTTSPCVKSAGKGTAVISATTPGTGSTVVTGTASFTVNNSSSASTINSLTITPGTATIAAIGQYAYLQAYGTSAAGTKSNLTTLASWSSSNPDIADVVTCPGGLPYACFLASKVGTVTITAYYSNGAGKPIAIDTATLTINNSASADFTSLAIYPGTQSAAVGQQTQFLIIGSKPSNGDQIDLTNDTNTVWTSSNTAIATVGTTGAGTPGRVLAKGVGSVTITATYTNQPDLKAIVAQATYTVTTGASTHIVSITLMPNTLSVDSPSSPPAYVKAIGTAADGSTHDLSTSGSLVGGSGTLVWSSSNISYATVAPCTDLTNHQSYGCITGVNQSSATITAVYTNPDDGSVATGTAAFSTLNASTDSLSALTFYPNTLSISKGTSTQHVFLTGTRTGSSNSALLTSTTNPVWASQNTAIATLTSDAHGGYYVTGVNVGSTTITATYTNPDGVTTVVQSLPVTVIAAAELGPLTAINIVPGDLTVSNQGMSGQYLAFGTFNTGNVTQDITNQVKWISTAPMVATISTGGVASAAGYTGNSVIYATYQNPDNSASATGSTIYSNPQTFTCKNASNVCGTGLPDGQFVYLSVITVGNNSASDGYITDTANSTSSILGQLHCNANNTGVCSAYFPVNAVITLTRVVTNTATFGGWSSGSNLAGGACMETDGVTPLVAGTTLVTSPTCTIRLSDFYTYDPTVGAIFN